MPIVDVLPNQLWCPRPGRGYSKRFRKPTGIGRKPCHGGLWTSTLDDSKYHSSWVEFFIPYVWTEGISPEEFDVEEWLNHCIVLAPKSGLRIYEIDSADDMKCLIENYGVPSMARYKFDTLDWDKISKDFDAVHITRKGVQETHYLKEPLLRGWDVESTVWLNNDTFETAFPLRPDSKTITGLGELILKRRPSKITKVKQYRRKK